MQVVAPAPAASHSSATTSQKCFCVLCKGDAIKEPSSGGLPSRTPQYQSSPSSPVRGGTSVRMSPGISKNPQAGNTSPHKLRPFRPAGASTLSTSSARLAKASPLSIRDLNDNLDVLSPPLTPMSMAPVTVSVRSPMSVVPQSPPISSAAAGHPASAPARVRIRRENPRMRAPTGLSDSEEEDEGDITLDPHGSFLSQPPAAADTNKLPSSAASDPLRKSELPPVVPPLAPAITDNAEILLREWEHRRQDHVRDLVKDQLSDLSARLSELRASAEADLAAQREIAARHSLAVQQALERDRRKHEAELARLLQTVQSEHAAQTQEGEHQLRKFQEEQEHIRLERQRKKEQEERERKQRDDAARQAREHEEKIKLAQQKLEADMKAAEEKKAKEAAAAAAAASIAAPASGPSVSASAAPNAPADSAARVKAYIELGRKSDALTGQAKEKRDRLTNRIRVAVNQVSNDWQQVQNCVAKITTLLQEAAIPEVIDALLYDAAGYVLEQTDCQISKHQDSAYGYGSFCLVLSVAFPSFINILLGCLNKECIYTVPTYITKQEGQTDQEVMRLQGYRPVGDDPNQLESEEEYTVRMQGAVALYAAMLQTNANRGGSQKNADLSEAWRWLARIANLKPRRITASMLFTFLELAGYRLNETYRKQFAKYVRFIRSDYLARLPASTPHAARGRLDMWTDTYEKARGQIPEPEGRVF